MPHRPFLRRGSGWRTAPLQFPHDSHQTPPCGFSNHAGAAKTPWLVEVSGDKLIAIKIGEEDTQIVFDQPAPANRVKALLNWVQSLDARNEYLVLAVKPSGIETFETVFPELDKAAPGLGLDLLEENQSVATAAQGLANP